MDSVGYKTGAFFGNIKRKPKAIYLIWLMINIVALFFVRDGFEYKSGFFPFTLSDSKVIFTDKDIMDIYDIINNPSLSQKDRVFWREVIKAGFIKRSTYDYSEFIFYLITPVILILLFDSLDEKKKSGNTENNKKEENTDPNQIDLSKTNMSQEKALKILGLTTFASNEEIIKAYKDLIKKYHPDYVSNLGDELKELANKKSQEINSAYELLMKIRGK